MIVELVEKTVQFLLWCHMIIVASSQMFLNLGNICPESNFNRNVQRYCTMGIIGFDSPKMRICQSKRRYHQDRQFCSWTIDQVWTYTKSFKKFYCGFMKFGWPKAPLKQLWRDMYDKTKVHLNMVVNGLEENIILDWNSNVLQRKCS